MPTNSKNNVRDLSHLRQDYQKRSLSLDSICANPLDQFSQWYDEIAEVTASEPNVMTLSTVATKAGEIRPSSRVVLLKGWSQQGFIFYTNYLSRKGHEIDQHPHVSLLFWWPELERQVRIEGVISKVSSEESDQYFGSRPVESQKSAVVSPQSQVIASKELLIQALDQLNQTHQQNEHVQRPEHWGGYQVSPSYFEFWQGRPNRLHDRVFYRLRHQQEESWEIGLLAP
jgi:pyridoxamine-phosphate oxidase